MALMITRMYGEEVEIGPNIRVKVLEARGREVRLFIDAPKDVKIIRGGKTPPVHSHQLATENVSSRMA
jgi:carbon storage regulator CsrA